MYDQFQFQCKALIYLIGYLFVIGILLTIIAGVIAALASAQTSAAVQNVGLVRPSVHTSVAVLWHLISTMKAKTWQF